MSHSYDAPNGTRFEPSSVSGQVLVVERKEPGVRSDLARVPVADLVAYVLQLPLDAIDAPVPGAPAAATVRDALEALGRVAGWDVNETRAANELRWEKP